MMSSLLTHKRPDLWGADAEVFRPERWLEAALLDKVASTPFMYSPFYGGPRVVRAAPFLHLLYCFSTSGSKQCIGQAFALNEAAYFIVRLLQRFRSFTFAPEYMPAGSLPPTHWAGMPGRQGVEKIHPAINLTVHSKVRGASVGGWTYS